jgi:hypothetical protein
MSPDIHSEDSDLLDWAAFEEVDELDDQDYHHHQLKYEGSRLIELLDHEPVEVLGGVDFLLD